MRQPRDDARPGLVEVELVEVEAESPLAAVAAEHYRRFHGGDSAPDDDDAADVAPPPVVAPPRHRQAARLRWVGLGVLVTMIAATIGINVVMSGRDAARRAELSQHPWILPVLSAPLQEAWQVTSGPWILAEVPGAVIISDVTETGSLRAIDTASGAELWSWGLVDERAACTALVGRDAQATGDGGRVPELLVCGPAGNYLRDHRPPEPGVTSTATVLDPVTGRQIDAVELAGTNLTLDLVGDDLLATYVTHDAAVGILRRDVGSGRDVWSFRSPAGLMPEGVFGEWGYRLGEDAVAVSSDDDAVAVSLETGEPVSPAGVVAVDRVTERRDLPGGIAVEWQYDVGELDGTGRLVGPDGTGRLVGPDGTAHLEFDGVPWRPWFSDGSVPDVVVVQRRGSGVLVAFDATTGERRWMTGTSGRPWPALQIDGLVVAYAGATVTAIDLRNGTQLWEMETDVTAGTSALTDGRVVLLPVRDGRARDLVAIELRSGLEMWRTAIPGGVVTFRPALDGTVLLITPSAIHGYR